MILKQVIKYTNANAIEATWVDENDNIVKCQAYVDVQMDMLRADLGVDALQYETLITEVESKIIPYIKSEYEIAQEAKALKLKQIEDDYIVSEEQTVEVSGVIYSGGTSSVEAIDSYVRLNRLAGNTTHNIWDVNGTEHTLTDSEVDSVILAIGVQASTNKFTKKNRKVALAVATTIAEVEAI